MPFTAAESHFGAVLLRLSAPWAPSGGHFLASEPVLRAGGLRKAHRFALFVPLNAFSLPLGAIPGLSCFVFRRRGHRAVVTF